MPGSKFISRRRAGSGAKGRIAVRTSRKGSRTTQETPKAHERHRTNPSTCRARRTMLRHLLLIFSSYIMPFLNALIFYIVATSVLYLCRQTLRVQPCLSSTRNFCPPAALLCQYMSIDHAYGVLMRHRRKFMCNLGNKINSLYP